MATLPPRIRLVVLFGGRSAEHDISCISATHVLRAVDPQRYDVVAIGIERSGRWMLAGGSELAAAGAPELKVAGSEIDPLPTLAGSRGDDIPTVVLPILHGPNGEDGTVQGLLELADLPYVGTGVLGSALAMDKAMAKTVCDALGIAQTAWHTILHTDRFDLTDAEAALDALGPTVFVKPANMGSSIGVSRVDAEAGAPALVEAVRQALEYDDVVVLEQGVTGRELECAVLGNDEPRASVVGEIVTEADFYDYGDKYFDGTATTVVPADLPTATAEEARRLAVRTFVALRCAGMARVDMFLETEAPGGGPGRGLLVNEVNTIPGFTPISMYPKMWEAGGLGYPELIDELVRLALERHARRASHRTSPA